MEVGDRVVTMHGMVTSKGRGAGTPSTVRPIMTDANDTKPGTGYESSGTDHEPQTDGGLSRRRFMGAAAALSALPALSSRSANATASIEGRTGGHGATRTDIESGAPVDSSMEVKEILTDETEISIAGYHYDDEDSEVEISVFSCMITSRLNCSPERARELAAALELAADEAEGDR